MEDNRVYDYITVQSKDKEVKMKGSICDDDNWAALQALAPCKATQHRTDGVFVNPITIEMPEKKK